MLEGMRKMSQGWAGRILMAIVMGFISLSFAVWGVGDIFRGFGSGTIAKVGGTEITSDAFRNAYQTQLQNLQREARRAITNDQARAIGLDRQVLTRLISEALLDDRSRDLKLGLSDQEIAKSILGDKTFAGPDGKFDANRFQELLRDNGFTELSFAREQRRVYLRQQIIEAMTGNLPVPTVLIDAVNRYRTETRAVEYFELPKSAAGDIPAPSDADLKAFYDSRPQAFRAPEYRKVTYLAISPANLADPKTVTDADAQALFERVKGQRFGTAEKRELEQVVFADEAAAAAASAKIKSGASLADAASQIGLSVVPLGNVGKGDIFDRAISAAGFALPSGGVSDPVKGQFGWVLVHALAITPESVKPFADVAADIKREIALERARKTASELRDKIEDERTSGKALADAAKSANLTPVVVEAIDGNGMDRAGKTVDLPERETLVRAIFASDIGVDNDLLSARDGGYVWFEIASIDPARVRSLDEVKVEAATAWKEEEISKHLADRASEIVKAIDGGQSMQDAAKAAGVEIKRDDKVRRIEQSTLPQGVVARAFGVPVGSVASAEGQNGTRIVFKVIDSVTPPLDTQDAALKTLTDQLRTALSEDILTQYLGRLQTESGVKVNDAAVNVAIGGSDPNAF